MNGVMPTIRPSTEPKIQPYSNALANDNRDMLPHVGGSFALDPAMDPTEQAESVLRHYNIDIPEVIPQTFKISEELGNDKIRAVQREFKKTSDEYYNAITSLPKSAIEDGRPHITSVLDLITNINTNYQKNFGEITKKATAFMEIVNTALGKLSAHIKAGSDGKINISPLEFAKEIDTAIEKYTGKKYTGGNNKDDANAYFGNWAADLSKAEPLHTITDGKEQFQFWKKKLDGQGFTVQQKGNDLVIYPDFKPIIEIYNTIKGVPAEWTGGDTQAQSFQSMQTAMDTQKNAVNNSVSRLLETFRQDNSHFETLTQLLVQLLKDLFQYNTGFANT